MGFLGSLLGGAGGFVMGGPVGAAVGAGIGGSVDNYMNTQATNAANLGIAREQMSFQERMSNTAYQRSMADMRAAGLNPMLAMGGSGASSPSGASATMQSPDSSGVGSALSSAIELKNVSKQFQKMDSEMDLLKAQTEQAAASKLASLNSAKKTDLESQAIGSQLQSIRSRGELENKKNVLGIKSAEYDWIMDRVRRESGTINNAVDALNPLKKLFKGIPKGKNNSAEDSKFDASGYPWD